MPQHRRRLLMEDNDTSFFNVVPTSQFDIPDWGETQGALYGVQMTNDKTKVLMMLGGTAQTAPTYQARIRIYENSNPNGIIESASDLTYVGETEEFNFEVGGVRQLSNVGFLYNEDLGKIWVRPRTPGTTDYHNIIGEWDFNIDTNTQSFVQYVTLPYTLGSFYFSSDGTQLYTSNNEYTGVTIVRYDLSTAFDISTYSVSETRSWNIDDGLIFTSPPFFYSNGGYGIYLSSYEHVICINKRQFATPFDFTSMELGSGYRQPIDKKAYGEQISISTSFPIFLSQDLRKMNYFGTSGAGGLIGIGYFNIPANFKGLGNELGGVRILPSTIITF